MHKNAVLCPMAIGGFSISILALVLALIGAHGPYPFGAIRIPLKMLEGGTAILVYGGTLLLPIFLGLLGAGMGAWGFQTIERSEGPEGQRRFGFLGFPRAGRRRRQFGMHLCRADLPGSVQFGHRCGGHEVIPMLVGMSYARFILTLVISSSEMCDTLSWNQCNSVELILNSKT